MRMRLAAATLAIATAVTGLPAAATADSPWATIAGTVTGQATGAPLGNVAVEVFEVFQAGFGLVATTVTAADGSYDVGDGVLRTGSYLVCFDARGASGGSARDGYPDACYHDLFGAVYAKLSSATPVATTAGQTTTGIDQSLPDAGAVNGHVTSYATGQPLAQVYVGAYDSSGAAVSGANPPGSTGFYKMSYLPAEARGYTVCAQSVERGPGHPYGYAGKCYRGVAFNGEAILPYDLPSATRPVPVRADATTTVDFTLNYAGAIGGTVTAAGQPIGDIDIVVFDPNGETQKFAQTRADGTFLVDELAANVPYQVCFSAENQPAFRSRCFGSSSDWNDTATAANADSTVVTVKARSRTGGIDVALPPTG